MDASSAHPTLATERLELRGYVTADVPELCRLIGARSVAATTIRIPHPYEESTAREWIGSQAAGFAAGRDANFAITLRESGQLVGGVGLVFDQENEGAELGYWIGEPYRGQGFATEAALALVDYGFGERGLHRIEAHHMGGNAASGRVLEKIGMKPEGRLRQKIKKWGVFEDAILYGLLRGDWERDPR